MASAIEMRQQDMVEMYQLLTIYRITYPNNETIVDELLEDIERRYSKVYGGRIASKRNPRNAGRKPKYTEEKDQEIKAFREEGLSYRQIAGKCGCSLNHVQTVLKEQVY